MLFVKLTFGLFSRIYISCHALMHEIHVSCWTNEIWRFPAFFPVASWNWRLHSIRRIALFIQIKNFSASSLRWTKKKILFAIPFCRQHIFTLWKNSSHHKSILRFCFHFFFLLKSILHFVATMLSPHFHHLFRVAQCDKFTPNNL